MVDKRNKESYTNVVVVFEEGKAIFKLYRDGVLIYIGVVNDRKDLQRVRDTCDG